MGCLHKPTDAARKVIRDAVANAKGQGWAQIRAFTFGTRLARITRHWRTRDMDAAMNAAGVQTQDRLGGIRIGECLAAFNKDRSYRVPGHAAVVLLTSDGLECDGEDGSLEKQMERLHLSCRHLNLLNPLLRGDGFAPRA